MKKNGILNSDISNVLSRMGHTDTICIGDCGLPVPEETTRIDLALTFGVPGFIQTLKAVVSDMKVEKIVMALEIKEKNPPVHAEIEKIFEHEDVKPEVEYVPHEELKDKTRKCKAVIRTGENTPYANIILQSACIF